MAVSRLAYATALGLCGLLYIAWGQWLQYIVLLALLVLPWVSLLLSIPAIRSFRAAPAGVDGLLRGARGELSLLGSCPHPPPPFRGRLRLKSCLTGEQRLYKPERGVPTSHCGGLSVTVERAWVCDYLGLFSFPVKGRGEMTLLIRPEPLPIPGLEEQLKLLGSRLRHDPQSFPEEYEPSPFAPGDSLRQIHWKLSAKTGKLLLRRGLSLQGPVVLTMELSGDSDTLDRKFGQLLWLGRRLLQMQLAFSLAVRTGEGLQQFSITSGPELEGATDRLLCCPALRDAGEWTSMDEGVWHCITGGIGDG